MTQEKHGSMILLLRIQRSKTDSRQQTVKPVPDATVIPEVTVTPSPVASPGTVETPIVIETPRWEKWMYLPDLSR